MYVHCTSLDVLIQIQDSYTQKRKLPCNLMNLMLSHSLLRSQPVIAFQQIFTTRKPSNTNNDTDKSLLHGYATKT